MVIVDCMFIIFWRFKVSNSFLGRTGNYNKQQSWNLSACFQFQNHCFFDFFAARNPVGLEARPCLHDGKITNAPPQCIAEIIGRTTPRPRSPIGTRFFHFTFLQVKGNYQSHWCHGPFGHPCTVEGERLPLPNLRWTLQPCSACLGKKLEEKAKFNRPWIRVGSETELTKA